MNIGHLRHRVTFQRATVTTNTLGENVQTWSDLVTTHARVEPLAGKERFAAMQQQAEVDYRVLCRYQAALADLAPDDRVLFAGQVFDVRAVINTDERNIELQVFVKRHI